MHPQLDAHFPPLAADRQMLGYNTRTDELLALDAAKAAGAKIVRGGGSWQSMEKTGQLQVPEGLKAGLEHCAKIGLKPMLIATPWAPAPTIGHVKLAAEAKTGSRILQLAGPLALKFPSDFIIKKNNVGQITARSNYAGSLIANVLGPGNAIELAAALNQDLSAGVELLVNRYRFAPPGDRNITSGPGFGSRAAFVRYAVSLAQAIHDAGCEGYVCVGNEEPWPDDKWIDLGDSYDNRPQGTSSGAMHTILAQFFGVQAPDGVRFISGATDTAGGSQGLLKQYQPDVVNNIGPNYIAQPTPLQIAAFAGEGIHPYGSNPEASLWNTDYEYLNPPQDGGSKFVEVAQRHATYGVKNGYHLETFATECGGRMWEKSEVKQAVYNLRRVLSLWMSGVPMALLYHLSPSGDPFSVVGAEFVPRQSATSLALLAGMMQACGPVGEDNEPPEFVAVTGNKWPIVSGGFHGQNKQIMFVWQRSFGEPKVKSIDPGGWLNLPPTPAAEVTVKSRSEALSAIDVLSGQGVLVKKGEGGTFKLNVEDRPIAVVQG